MLILSFWIFCRIRLHIILKNVKFCSIVNKKYKLVKILQSEDVYMEFFQDFNFDTLLALISCIVGIIALFVGGTAYRNCKIQKNQ